MEDDITKISDLLSSTVYDQKGWSSTPDWNLDYSRMIFDDIDKLKKQLLNQAYGKLGTTQTKGFWPIEEEPDVPHTVSVSTEIDDVEINYLTAETRENMYRNSVVITTGSMGEEELSWCRDNCTDLWMNCCYAGKTRPSFRFASKEDMIRFMEKFGG